MLFRSIASNPVAPALLGVRRAPLVGREEEQDGLWEELQATRLGPRVVVLTGQPGAGATRLATWLGERATEMGVANVLFARHAGAVDDGLPGAIARWLRADGLDGEAAFRWVHSLADAAGPVLPEEVPALVERLAPAEPPRVRFRDERERARPLRTFVDALARREIGRAHV